MTEHRPYWEQQPAPDYRTYDQRQAAMYHSIGLGVPPNAWAGLKHAMSQMGYIVPPDSPPKPASVRFESRPSFAGPSSSPVADVGIRRSPAPETPRRLSDADIAARRAAQEMEAVRKREAEERENERARAEALRAQSIEQERLRRELEAAEAEEAKKRKAARKVARAAARELKAAREREAAERQAARQLAAERAAWVAAEEAGAREAARSREEAARVRAARLQRDAMRAKDAARAKQDAALSSRVSEVNTLLLISHAALDSMKRKAAEESPTGRRAEDSLAAALSALDQIWAGGAAGSGTSR